MIDPFSEEQSRCLINLEQRYRGWIEAERALAALPYDLRRKKVGEREYLYEVHGRDGNGTSRGAMTELKEAALASYKEQKSALKERRAAASTALDESARLYRALRLPLLASEAGEILREADIRGLLGTDFMVVGTNAIPAYAIEAGGFIRDVPQETQDLDIAWTATKARPGERPILSLLKAVDNSFTMNSEREFQARNAKAYEVEVLVAPSRAKGIARTDQPRPMALAEQEWLLLGTPVEHVVVCRDASPARIVAPDPRWFALQKMWMARQDKRNPLKRRKDERQGMALLNAVHQSMPNRPLDEAFDAELPDELVEIYRGWRADRPERGRPAWVTP